MANSILWPQHTTAMAMTIGLHQQNECSINVEYLDLKMKCLNLSNGGSIRKFRNPIVKRIDQCTFGSSIATFCNPLKWKLNSNVELSKCGIFLNKYKNNSKLNIFGKGRSLFDVDKHNYLNSKTENFNLNYKSMSSFKNYRDKERITLKDTIDRENYNQFTYIKKEDSDKSTLTITYSIIGNKSYKQELKITLDDPFCALKKFQDRCAKVSSLRELLDNLTSICNEIDSAPCNKRFITNPRDFQSQSLSEEIHSNNENLSDTFDAKSLINENQPNKFECSTSDTTSTSNLFSSPIVKQMSIEVTNENLDKNVSKSIENCSQNIISNLATNNDSNSSISSKIDQNELLAMKKKELLEKLSRLNKSTQLELPKRKKGIKVMLPKKRKIDRNELNDSNNKESCNDEKKSSIIHSIVNPPNSESIDNLCPANKIIKLSQNETKQPNVQIENQPFEFKQPDSTVLKRKYNVKIGEERTCFTEEKSFKNGGQPNCSSTAEPHREHHDGFQGNPIISTETHDRNESSENNYDQELNHILIEMKMDSYAMILSPIATLQEEEVHNSLSKEVVEEITPEVKSNISELQVNNMEFKDDNSVVRGNDKDPVVKYNENILTLPPLTNNLFKTPRRTADYLEDKIDGLLNKVLLSNSTKTEKEQTSDNNTSTNNNVIVKYCNNENYKSDNNDLFDLPINLDLCTTVSTEAIKVIVVSENPDQNLSDTSFNDEAIDNENSSLFFEKLPSESEISTLLTDGLFDDSADSSYCIDKHSQNLEDTRNNIFEEHSHITKILPAGFYLSTPELENQQPSSNIVKDNDSRPSSKPKVNPTEMIDFRTNKLPRIAFESDAIPCEDNALHCALKFCCKEVLKMPKKSTSLQKNVNPTVLASMKNILVNYCKSTDVFNSLKPIAQEVAPRANHQVANLILELLVNDKSKDEIKKKNRLIPALTTIQKCLWMAVIVISQQNNKFIDVMLTSIEQVLASFNDKSLTVQNGAKMAHFYTIICKSQGLINRARCLVCDILYTRGVKAYPIIFSMCSTWSVILPNNNVSQECLLSLTIALLLIKIPSHLQISDSMLKSYNITLLRRAMQYRYGFKGELIEYEDLFIKLLNNLNKKGSDVALILLCKCLGYQWSLKMIESKLFTLLQKSIDENNDEQNISELIVVTGKIIRGFPALGTANFVAVTLDKFEKYLNECQSFVISEALVEGITLLRKHNLLVCAKILANWTPKTKNLGKGMIHHIKTVLSVKSITFWNNFIETYSSKS